MRRLTEEKVKAATMASLTEWPESEWWRGYAVGLRGVDVHDAVLRGCAHQKPGGDRGRKARGQGYLDGLAAVVDGKPRFWTSDMEDWS